MFEVTEKAKEKLLQILQSKTDDPDACIRLNIKPEEKRLALSIDRKQSSDHVIKDKKDKNVLLVASSSLSSLESHVFDFKEEQEGGGFIVSPIAADDKKS